MEFRWSDAQVSRAARGRLLAAELVEVAPAPTVARLAAGLGLFDGKLDALSVAAVIEILAETAPEAALVVALHGVVVTALAADARASALEAGGRVGSLTLSTETVPVLAGDRLQGRASWVGPLTDGGVALLAARQDDALIACVVDLGGPGVEAEPIRTEALDGVSFGHLALHDAAAMVIGPTPALMARARVGLAAVGIGIGQRALREALTAVRGTSQGAGGEQTVQGLVADAATDLEAARMLLWQAASTPDSLAAASMAKLAATAAAQRAVAHAAQAVGVEAFRRGHIIGRLAQDVRALELFAGRTEALREAIADEALPRV